jgi:hypothetical protein
MLEGNDFKSALRLRRVFQLIRDVFRLRVGAKHAEGLAV